MKIDVLTLFPEMFAGPLDYSMVKRAREAGQLDLRLVNLRDFTHDRHKTVDDKPFGGGPGMLLKPEPIFEAVETLANEKTRVLMMTPSGRTFNQQIARELATYEHLLFLCGAYEGFDERVRTLVHDELSIGDFVLTNGALPAMVILMPSPGCCRECSVMIKAQWMNRSATVCWNIRTIHGRRNSGA